MLTAVCHCLGFELRFRMPKNTSSAYRLFGMYRRYYSVNRQHGTRNIAPDTSFSNQKKAIGQPICGAENVVKCPNFAADVIGSRFLLKRVYSTGACCTPQWWVIDGPAPPLLAVLRPSVVCASQPLGLVFKRPAKWRYHSRRRWWLHTGRHDGAGDSDQHHPQSIFSTAWLTRSWHSAAGHPARWVPFAFVLATVAGLCRCGDVTVVPSAGRR